MYTSARFRLVAFGVALHALLMYAMIDVHFATPLVHGMEPMSADFAPSAKRLVVIVADGLRADRLFELETEPGADAEVSSPRAPFLHRIAREEGRWGVSHARPPTESRPGLVSLLAGFYEDPSAITKGWHANAVEFDHLLNQSSAAWAIGAPSVVPLFASGISHIRARAYDDAMEDFAASSDHAALDEYVLDRVQEVLRGNVTDEEARSGANVRSEQAALEGDRVVFLLHLLGVDSAGHAHKPHGEGYLSAVRAVDDVARRVHEAFETRFGKDGGGTAYVFTADHGMNRRGGHGDGDPECTETPFIAWGAGVGAASDAKETNAACRPRGKDAPTPEMEWGLKDATRCDVDQADVAALGASLLGMAPPKHNSGVLPVSYLNSARPDIRSGAAVANAAQMLSVYRRKVSVTSSTSIMAYVSPTGFRPYAPLINADETLAGLELAHARGDHATAIEGAQALSLECVWGNAYLHSYDKVLLMGVITACFLSWMAFLGVHLRVERGGVSRVGEASSKTRATAGAAVVSIATSGVLLLRSSPVTYYAYFNLPVYFAWHCFTTLRSVSRSRTRRRTAKRVDVWGVVVTVVAIILTQVLCQSFHDRRIYTGLFCIACVAFTTLAVWFSFLMLLAASSCVVISVDRLQTAEERIPDGLHATAWLIAVGAIPLPLLSPRKFTPRFVSVYLAAATVYALFSVSYESMFYSILGAAALAWMTLERYYQIHSIAMTCDVGDVVTYASVSTTRSLHLGDVRHAAVFLVLINAAFFGTGNIASVASFEMSSVYRFTTRFNPYLMGGLLVLKVLVPMFTVAVAFLMSLKLQGADSFGMYLIFIALSDCMAIRFFYQITTVGSWADIGHSISRYALMGTQVVSILLFLGVADVFTRVLPINGVCAVTARARSKKRN
ncbi:ATP exporter family [Micromonas pusilla CCMP1545]|uniref:GPI ethanolamine phosphate transferase 1 n=1 Tax=Micromonas pusilla (strain CCMP1545) TaxID=564608 RepID=C1MQ57_MICPC|nr:ATP exporter family [Micromonas pusilla CCMP1545]EEH57651.1 ATP exporter family [Micromonas pusilla CCMP1545]|eukprot:XP_003057700.1 ATP exporter family [Micromonas pusilla CCMP1545]